VRDVISSQIKFEYLGGNRCLLDNKKVLTMSAKGHGMPVSRSVKNHSNSYCSHAIISKSIINMVTAVIYTSVTDTENTDQLYLTA